MANKHDGIIAVLMALIAFAVFAFQACPTFYFWDSAELTAAIAGGGIPHPPGFPLYLITGTVAKLLIPLKVSALLPLMSAFVAALAIGILYLALARFAQAVNSDLLMNRLAALIGVLVLTFSYSITAQATRAEVYALQFLLYSIIFLVSTNTMTTIPDSDADFKKIILGCFVVGLAMANHSLTAMLILPALVLTAFKGLTMRRLLVVVLAITIPLSTYFYLMFLAAFSPIQNWGDPKTLKSLFDVVTAAEFDKSIAAFAPSHVYENWLFALQLIFKQLGPLLTVLAALGLVAMAMKFRRAFWFLLLILSGSIMSTIFNELYYYENLDIHGYLTAALITAIYFSAYGLLWISNRFAANRRLTAVIVVGFIGLVLAVVPNFGKASLKGNHSAERLAHTLADECDGSAVLFCSSYNTYFLIQALQAEGIREDILPIHIHQLERKWYRRQLANRFNLQSVLDINQSAESFYRQLINIFKDKLAIMVEYDEGSSPLRNYLWPEGFLWKFKSEKFSPNNIDGQWNLDNDIARFENYLHSGTDYEELKSMAWILRNRMQFFADHGRPDIADRYYAEVDRIAKEFKH